MGRAMRIMPNPPSLSSTPARMTLPAVGAAVWASGSHVWKGHRGTLMAKAIKKAQKARTAYVEFPPNGAPSACPRPSPSDSSTMSNVPWKK